MVCFYFAGTGMGFDSADIPFVSKKGLFITNETFGIKYNYNIIYSIWCAVVTKYFTHGLMINHDK